jgi:phosphatidylserine decarboxylase
MMPNELEYTDMKHAGKARRAGFRLITITLIGLLLLIAGGVIAALLGSFIIAAATTLLIVWIAFAAFCLLFFRDPDPQVPADSKAIVSPAHGKIDLIDETTESEFMGGVCKRVSIFLSVVDIHVQNAPISGRVAYFKHCPGQFLNAMSTECSAYNENVLIGIESSELSGEKLAFRLVAGLLARRIVPWVAFGEEVIRGERTSLIQFGSRVDLYLPLNYSVTVKLGDRVKGGESVIAMRS